MAAIHTILTENPAGLLFLVIGIGFAIGKLRVGSFEFGSVSGVLFAGLAFGYFDYTLSPTVQTMGFVLFIFSVGFEAGPKFFSVLRTDGLRYLALAIVIATSAFGLALTLSRALSLEPGAVAGLLAGGMTSSPTLAAAEQALRNGQVPLPDGITTEQMITNVTTAYAITYLFGLIGLLLIIQFLPRLVGIDFKAEATKLASQAWHGIEDEVKPLPDIVARAYHITESELVGIPLAQLYEQSLGLVALGALRRDGEMIEVTAATAVELGDDVAIVGHLGRLLELGPRIGSEIHDAELQRHPVESCRVVVMRSKAKKANLTPGQVYDRYGCFIARIVRLGVVVPPDTAEEFEPGDVLHVTGHRAALDRLGAELGHIERAVDETDLVTFGLGIAAGTMLGTLTVTVAGIPLGFGAAGGLLTTGLVIGYLRALRPTFGRVPSAARWIFMELGLLTFMAGVGLRAGSGLLDTLSTSGPSLFLAGILVTSIPVLIGFAFGRWVLGIHPVFLLGGITGSMTSGGALGVVNRAAGNSLPALGYTGAYAFANVLLTIAGSVILLM
jgi:putative transport protein